MAYAVPTPADLKAYYPAFASVADTTVQIYLDRVSGESGSGGDVDTSWIEGDYGPAIMAAAAHRMARNGILGASSGGDVSSFAAAGVTSIKSGTFQAQFSDAAVTKAMAGGWGSTIYGEEYLALLRRNKGGPRVTAPGHVPFCGLAKDGPLPC